MRLIKILPALLVLMCCVQCNHLTVTGGFGFAVQENGQYRVEATGWQFSGALGGPTNGITSSAGTDLLGAYRETSFEYAGGPCHVSVRAYPDLGAIQFDVAYPNGHLGNGIAFPFFTELPKGLSMFSYRNQSSAPPTFSASQTCSPLLCFDGSDRAYILSPASNFLVTRVRGNGVTSMIYGFGLEVGRVPTGIHQKSLMIFGRGINHTWEIWSKIMRALYPKDDPKKDGDVVLDKYGYYTNNAADYYYNFEPDLGYAGTLLALRRRYQAEGIPIAYMQFDSWWYDKSINDPSGHPVTELKNPKLPNTPWNHFGGVLSYRADKDLFPNGLADFQSHLGLPLILHNRWIDRKSPDRKHFRISGLGSVDPKWWNDTAAYLASCGAATYQQGWLNQIYDHSRGMRNTVGVGDAFTRCMARSMGAHGLRVQYSLATPAFFMESLLYPNVTTVQANDGRFDPSRWRDFIYVTQFAHGVGLWPWCNGCKSAETGSMIVSVLSGGPVGSSDRMGAEDKANILRAARPDGVIVKPDEPLVPIDQTYLDEAARVDRPFVGFASTGAGAVKTVYAFAFAEKGKNPVASIPLGQTGIDGRCYLFNAATNEGKYVEASDTVTESLGASGYACLELAPVLPGGIVILGDLGKFVPTGRQRLSRMEVASGGVRLEVRFAKGESVVRVVGVSPKMPTVTGAKIRNFAPTTGRFEVEVESKGAASASITISGR